MAIEAANLFVKIGADTGGLDSALGEIGGKLKSFSGEAVAFGGALNTIAFGAVAGGVVALGAGLASCAKEAMDAQMGFAQLDAVIKSTGGVAGVTAEMARGLADSLQQVTPFADDAVIAGENMLLTFTNIGKDIFPQATEMALDMSQALGQDVTSSAMQLGKALNDPIAGVTALRRVGVQLTDEQEKQVKAMMAVGDVAGAQGVILAELTREFGGSAKAAGNTFAGQLAILGHAFDDVKETIGNAVIPILKKFADFIISKMPAIMRIIDTTIVPAIKTIGEVLGVVFDDILSGDIGLAFDDFRESLVGIVPKPVLDAMTGLYIAIKGVFDYINENQAAVIGALQGIGIALAGFMAFTAITGIIAAIANPITLIIGLAALLGAAWAGNWGGIQEKTAAVIAFVLPLFQAFIANMQAIWQGLQPVFQAVGTAINAVIGALTPIFQNLFGQIQSGLVNLNPMIEAFKGLWTELQPVISAVANVLGVVLVVAIGYLSSIIGGLVNAIQPWVTMIAGIVTGFVTMLTGYINVIVGLFTGDMDKVRTGGEQIFSGLKTVVESLITGMINTVIAFVSGFVSTFLGFFTKLGIDLEGTVTGIVTNVVKWFSQLPGKMVDVGRSIIQGIIDGIGQMIGALINTLGDVAAKIKNAVMGALSTEGTSGGMGVPGKALGGSVFDGSPYIVGERGPELFVPRVSGTIIPNNKLSAGGTTINLGGITISGNADSSTVKQAAYNGVMAAARAMGAM